MSSVRILIRSVAAVMIVWASLSLRPCTAAQSDPSLPSVRADLVDRLAQQSRVAKEMAEDWAWTHGAEVGFEVDGVRFELMYLYEDRPIYYRTLNVNAAFSTTTDRVRNQAPYDLNGEGMTIGLWDVDMPRRTHQEFQNLPNRIIYRDGYVEDEHTTHIAGTLGASGRDPNALGMAPLVKIDAHDWDDDLSEMAEFAASFPGEPGKVCVSNHSYGLALGWVPGRLPTGERVWFWFPVWLGIGNTNAEILFGQYVEEAVKYDEVSFMAPYYQIFVAAGNDRTDNPVEGETVYYSTDSLWWRRDTYRESLAPGDGRVKGGYDTIHPAGVAKNVITVGAISDAVRDGVRSLNDANMTAYSSWGPADDGRVKPDIVANGDGVYSTSSSGNDKYEVMSGTSMACANASGSSILLVQYYGRLFPGKAMRASTLKGLILHTADDLGNPGPDYSFGWGLLNVETACALLKAHAQQGQGQRIVEEVLSTIHPMDTYTVSCDGTRPLRVTLCWTDPVNTQVHGLDDRTPCLVNDLDLRVIGPGGVTILPYILDPNHPQNPATQGDNRVDNVEQVYIPTPLPGIYTLQISYMKALTMGQQWYSLVSDLSVERSETAPTLTLEWTHQTGTSGSEEGCGIAADGQGHIFITGFTTGVLDGQNARGKDVFISKYDANGIAVWTKQPGIPGDDSGRDIATDGQGNIFIGGDKLRTIDIYCQTCMEDFITKYDTEGNRLWTQSISTWNIQGDYHGGIASDNIGNVYVTGHSRVGLVNNSGGWRNEFYVARYDALGNRLWLRETVFKTSNEFTEGISVDGLGNIFITGDTDSSLAGPSTGWVDAFVINYDIAGNLLWTRQFGTPQNDLGLGIATDGLGNAFVTGYTTHSLGGPNAGAEDLFVSKFDANGNLLWTRQIGTKANDRGLAVTTDGQGNAFVAGYSLGALGEIHTGGGNGDVFVAKFDAAGTLVWSMQFGSNSSDVGNAVSTDRSGNVYITGYTWGSMGRPSAGSKDIFITKIRDGNK